MKYANESWGNKRSLAISYTVMKYSGIQLGIYIFLLIGFCETCWSLQNAKCLDSAKCLAKSRFWRLELCKKICILWNISQTPAFGIWNLWNISQNSDFWNHDNAACRIKVTDPIAKYQDNVSVNSNWVHPPRATPGKIFLSERIPASRAKFFV